MNGFNQETFNNELNKQYYQKENFTTEAMKQLQSDEEEEEENIINGEYAKINNISVLDKPSGT
jgi:hypothetical protein